MRFHSNNINRDSGIILRFQKRGCPQLIRHRSETSGTRLTTEADRYNSGPLLFLNTNDAKDRNQKPMSEVRNVPITNNHG